MGMILHQRPMQAYFAQDRAELVPVLRLAALLHDVGHLPFSHVGEMAWNATRASDAFGYRDRPEESVFDVAASASAKPALHEQLSTLVIEHSRIGALIDETLPPIGGNSASEVVARIVGGEHSNLVVRNLLSSDLDCDRLDYLLRDSLAAGLVYGNIDLSYLIGNLLIAEDDHGEALLAIDRRHGLLAGEHFLLARYYHYAQFISHKTVASAEVDLVAAMIELIRIGVLPPPDALLEGSDADRLRTLLALTDARVQNAVAQAPSDHSSESELLEASRRLSERKLLKAAARDEQLEDRPRPGSSHAHTWDTRLRRPEDKITVAADCNVDPSMFCYRRTSLPLTGIEGDVAPATAIEHPDDVQQGFRKSARVSDGGAPPKLLIAESQLLGHLSMKQWTTRRVFYREALDSYYPARCSREFGRVRRFFEEELGAAAQLP